MAVLLESADSRDALIAVNGEKFVFCDPTYIGADLGMMPDIYKGQSPKLIW
jgi:site-specific DNA-adenine methylase